jgi:hypothetical protein
VSNAKRQARYRQRQRDHRAVLPVQVDAFGLDDAIAECKLTESPDDEVATAALEWWIQKMLNDSAARADFVARWGKTVTPRMNNKGGFRPETTFIGRRG